MAQRAYFMSRQEKHIPSLARRTRILASSLVNFALFSAIRMIACAFRRRSGRILIVRSDGIGDFILFTDCLKVLAEHFAPAVVDIAMPDHCADLAERLR